MRKEGSMMTGIDGEGGIKDDRKKEKEGRINDDRKNEEGGINDDRNRRRRRDQR